MKRKCQTTTWRATRRLALQHLGRGQAPLQNALQSIQSHICSRLFWFQAVCRGRFTNPGGMEIGQHRRAHGSAHCFLHIRALLCRAMSRWSFFDHPIHARTIYCTFVNAEQRQPMWFANT